MTETKGEYATEHAEMPGHLEGCESSYRLSDGSIYSQRGRKSSKHWTQECERVASHLEIPIAQHQGMYSVEYIVKDIPKPHQGLLAKRMVYWLLVDFAPEAERALGTLVVSIHMHQSEGIGHPVVLYLQGFNAAFAAWPSVKERGEESNYHADWVRVTRGLLSQWWAEKARDLHQLEG